MVSTMALLQVSAAALHANGFSPARSSFSVKSPPSVVISWHRSKRFAVSSALESDFGPPRSPDAPGIALPRPDAFGRFGRFGGKYVPETLICALSELEDAFRSLSTDPSFQEELDIILRDYVGRRTPLYFAERLTEHHKRPNGQGPLIYLKREDLNHTGAYKINNAIP